MIKFNGGKGALICDKCSVIIRDNFFNATKEEIEKNNNKKHYCEKCKMKKRSKNKYSILVQWDPKSKEFIARCQEFPHLSGIDSLKIKAIKDLEEAIEMSIGMIKESTNYKLPKPIYFKKF